jgi:hypothetical protein
MLEKNGGRGHAPTPNEQGKGQEGEDSIPLLLYLLQSIRPDFARVICYFIYIKNFLLNHSFKKTESKSVG